MTSPSTTPATFFAPARRPLAYWLMIFPFALIFAGSIALNIVDVRGGEIDYVELGFPAWLVWWATLAKVLGLLAIAWGRSRTLSIVAYAGFVYDLLLAITAHLYTMPLLLDRLGLAVATLGFTVLAVWAEHRYTWRRAGAELRSDPRLADAAPASAAQRSSTGRD